MVPPSRVKKKRKGGGKGEEEQEQDWMDDDEGNDVHHPSHLQDVPSFNPRGR